MLWVCKDCGSRPAVGVSPCPQCGGTDVGPEESDMPKITRETGPSYNDAEGNPVDLAPGTEGEQRAEVTDRDAREDARGYRIEQYAGRDDSRADDPVRHTDGDNGQADTAGTAGTAGTEEEAGKWPGKSSEASPKSDDKHSKRTGGKSR